MSRSGEIKVINAYEMQSLAASVKKLNKDSLFEILNKTILLPEQVDDSSGTTIIVR